MREIKFRAWDIDNKMFVYLLIGHHSVNPVIAPIKGNFDVWQQYTGLKDKNGKEIYEGDLVKWWETHIPENRFVYQVVFNTARFLLKGETAFDVKDLEVSGKYTQVEVIGNLYENPELLNPNAKR